MFNVFLIVKAEYMYSHGKFLLSSSGGKRRSGQLVRIEPSHNSLLALLANHDNKYDVAKKFELNNEVFRKPVNWLDRISRKGNNMTPYENFSFSTVIDRILFSYNPPAK